MKLVIRTDEKVLYDGEVTAVTSFNEVGVFDILPEHIQFVTLVKEKVVAHKNKQAQEIVIESGILKVKNDVVEVYVG